jgi:hypothetical protein
MQKKDHKQLYLGLMNGEEGRKGDWSEVWLICLLDRQIRSVLGGESTTDGVSWARGIQEHSAEMLQRGELGVWASETTAFVVFIGLWVHWLCGGLMKRRFQGSLKFLMEIVVWKRVFSSFFQVFPRFPRVFSSFFQVFPDFLEFSSDFLEFSSDFLEFPQISSSFLQVSSSFPRVSWIFFDIPSKSSSLFNKSTFNSTIENKSNSPSPPQDGSYLQKLIAPLTEKGQKKTLQDLLSDFSTPVRKAGKNPSPLPPFVSSTFSSLHFPAFAFYDGPFLDPLAPA